MLFSFIFFIFQSNKKRFAQLIKIFLLFCLFIRQPYNFIESFYIGQIQMQKQNKKFSRKSTAEVSNITPDQNKQKKIERRQVQKVTQAYHQKKKIIPNQQYSEVSHITKRSLFDRKSSQQTEGRPKSVAVTYKGNYKQPVIFGLNDKQFLQAYLHDPFAKEKITYVLKQNDLKMKQQKVLGGMGNMSITQKLQEFKSLTLTYRKMEEIEDINTEKTFIRCKSESDLIQAQQCEHYKQLIVVNSQSYSGCTV